MGVCGEGTLSPYESPELPHVTAICCSPADVGSVNKENAKVSAAPTLARISPHLC